MILKKIYKLFKEDDNDDDDDDDYVIQSKDQRINLFDAVNLIVGFNETIQLDLV